jgi:hypothetical protein
MTTRRATIYVCDAPDCNYTVTTDKKNWVEVEGIHGTVGQVGDGGGVDAGRWFACSFPHVLPAINHVLMTAWEDEGI